jgi:hypothetical protein
LNAPLDRVLEILGDILDGDIAPEEIRPDEFREGGLVFARI